MPIKRDCFAYKEDNIYVGCNALDKLYCTNENCKFYKTKEQLEKDNIKNK